MPRYKLTLQDGREVQVESQTPLNEEQVKQEAARKLATQYEVRDRVATSADEPGLFEDIAEGFYEGATGAMGMGARGVAGLLTEGDREEQLLSDIAAWEERQRAGNPNRDSIPFKVASATGSIVPMIGAGVAGAAAAPYVGATAGIGSLLGSGLAATSMGAGEAGRRARDAGLSGEEALPKELMGTVVGASELVPFGMAGRAITRLFRKDAAEKLGAPYIKGVQDRLTRVARTGTAEGLQEAAANEAQNMIERGYNPEAVIGQGSAEEGALGAAAGSIVQLVLDAFVPGKTRAARYTRDMINEATPDTYRVTPENLSDDQALALLEKSQREKENFDVIEELNNLGIQEEVEQETEQEAEQEAEQVFDDGPGDIEPVAPESERLTEEEALAMMAEQAENEERQAAEASEAAELADIEAREAVTPTTDQEVEQDDGVSELGRVGRADDASGAEPSGRSVQADRESEGDRGADRPGDTGGTAEPVGSDPVADNQPDVVDAVPGTGTAPDTLRIEEVDDGNWGFGPIAEDGVFESIEEGFESEADARSAAEDFRKRSVQNTRAIMGAMAGEKPAAQEPVETPETEPTQEAEQQRDERQRRIYEGRLQDLTAEEKDAAIEQLRQDVDVDERTGLGTNRKWLRTPDSKKKHIAAIDLDNLKAVNDNMGHDAGDRMIAAVGDAMRSAGIAENAYHISGDEFYVHGTNKAKLNKALKAAQKALSENTIEGEGLVFPAPSMSYGIGSDLNEAESAMMRDKLRREEKGDRTPRGQIPERMNYADGRPFTGEAETETQAEPEAAETEVQEEAAETEATPEPEAEAETEAEPEATATPEPEAAATPEPEAEAEVEAETTPRRRATDRPLPDRVQAGDNRRLSNLVADDNRLFSNEERLTFANAQEEIQRPVKRPNKIRDGIWRFFSKDNTSSFGDAIERLAYALVYEPETVKAGQDSSRDSGNPAWKALSDKLTPEQQAKVTASGRAHAREALKWLEEKVPSVAEGLLADRIAYYKAAETVSAKQAEMVDLDVTTGRIEGETRVPERAADTDTGLDAANLSESFLARVQGQDILPQSDVNQFAVSLAEKQIAARGDSSLFTQLRDIENDMVQSLRGNALYSGDTPAQSAQMQIDNLSRIMPRVDREVSEVLEEETVSLEDLDELAIETGLDLDASGRRIGGPINAGTRILSPGTWSMLQDGDLKTALADIAYNTADTRIARLVTGMMDKLGNTKVRVESNPMVGDREVFAYYDNGTDTIVLRRNENPMVVDPNSNAVVMDVLHEAVHATTNGTLGNKSHPLTKKLEAIMQKAKDNVPGYNDTAFKNVREFVAETMTNPQFRNDLRHTYLDGAMEPSALTRIYNAIRNFLRGLVGLGNVDTMPDSLTDLEKLIESAMTRDTTALVGADASGRMRAFEAEYPTEPHTVDGTFQKFVKDVSNRWHQRPRSEDKPSAERTGQKILDNLKLITPAILKNNSLAVLPMVALRDMGKWMGFQPAVDLERSISRLVGDGQIMGERIEARIKTVQDTIKGFDGPTTRAWQDLVNESTLQQVNMLRDKSFYAKDKDKQESYDRLLPLKKKVGPEGMKAYKNLMDLYKDLYNQSIDAMKRRIDETVESTEDAERIKNKLVDTLLKKNELDPYFPLYRDKGNFWLTYAITFIDPKTGTRRFEQYYESFDSRASRDAYKEQLLAEVNANKDTIVFDKNNMVEYMSMTHSTPVQNIAPQSLIGEILEKVPEEQKQGMAELLIDYMPETSFARRLQSRSPEQYRGYIQDPIYVAKHKAYDMGRQLVKIKHSKGLYDQLAKADELVGPTGKFMDDGEAMVLRDELRKRVGFALQPQGGLLTEFTRQANRTAFLYTLGFNVSSAVVNATQLPFIVAPYLANKEGVGFKKATNMMVLAARLIESSPSDRQTLAFGGDQEGVSVSGDEGLFRQVTKRGFRSIDNYYIVQPDGELVLRDDIEDVPDYYNGMSKREVLETIKPIVKEADLRGLLAKSVMYDTLDVEQAGRDYSTSDKLSAASAYLFHTMERRNRQVALISSYLANNESTPNRGEMGNVDQAVYDAQMTNGGAVLETAPRIAQKHFGRIMMMYRTFGVQMYYHQATLLYRMKKEGFLTSEAAKQFWTTQGVITLGAGIQGLTLYGIVSALADMFFFDDEEESFDTRVRKAMGEPVYKGGVNQLTKLLGGEGVDVASRIGLSNMILQKNRYNIEKSIEESIFEQFGGPAWSTIKRIGRAGEEFMNGEFQRGLEAAVPTGISNVLKAGRFATVGPETRRGDPIMDDNLSFGLLAAQFFGFSPAEYTRNQERNQSLKGIDKAVNSRRTRLLRRYYMAMRNGGDVADAMEEIQEFNEEWPNFAIDSEAIERSMKTHMKTSLNMHDGVLLSPGMREYLNDLSADWNR